MPEFRPPERPSDLLVEESPIAWFGEMLRAWNRRDIDRAAEAKRQLARLGWSVQFRLPPGTRRGLDGKNKGVVR
jgi:hypothetical protein